MSTLADQIGRDIDRRVGDEQQSVERRRVHREDMADAAIGAQARLLLDDGAEEFVGMHIALHDRARRAALRQFDGARAGLGVIRGVHDPFFVERRAPPPRRVRCIFARGPIRTGSIKPRAAARSAPASEF